MDPACALLRPPIMYTSEDVRHSPCPVPAAAGAYAWYFTQVPPLVPTEHCHTVSDAALLYVGISPKAPSRSGHAVSRQTVRTRIRYHFRGNAAGSTLRLTLGCLLADDLQLQLRRVGGGTRLTFGPEGESRVSAWMTQHARVVWVETATAWDLEHRLIREMVLPLNLDQNRHSSFHSTLTGLRVLQRTRARSSPILQ